MIFRRSLVRELTATAIGLFVVLAAILFTNLVLRLLGQAAGGAVAPDGILALLGFAALVRINILLAVALFLTVLLTLSRWYRDSEMIVWMTSGQSTTALLKPILWFSAPFLVAILALSLFLSPWAEKRKAEFERQLETRDELAYLSPGLFREFKAAHLVVFVESINTFDGTIRNVFLHSIDDRKDSSTVAHAARLVTGQDGSRYVVLENGSRFEGAPGSADFRIVEFERLARVIQPAVARALPVSYKAIPTDALALAEGDAERAELFWRISVPILAFVLTLLAIPLAHVNPRLGRTFNLFSAAFIYFSYTNFINVVQSLIAQGKLGFWPGLLLPHGIALAVVVLLFRHQLSVHGLLGRPPPAGPPAPSEAAA